MVHIQIYKLMYKNTDSMKNVFCQVQSVAAYTLLVVLSLCVWFC